MGLFNRMKEPVFLKESSNAQTQLEKLQKLEPLLNNEGQAKIKQDIKYLEYGISGEKNIAFELKNSHMPMYVLHDIYLECGDLSAQIDYLVFTRKICFIIECKNLYGNIEINNAGDFIRTMEFDGKRKKEGIYSPITQNQRHLELIKKIKIDKKNNILAKLMFERCFEDFNKSVVVLANPKTVLNAKYAKKEVKDRVIRADQLISYIKEVYKQSNAVEESDEGLLTWANSYLELHMEIEKDYTGKYDAYRMGDSAVQLIEAEAVVNETAAAAITDTGSLEDSEIFQELKAYRLAKSREEKIKPYYICNDNQLRDLINQMPRSKDELATVAGFGEAKVNKYGEDILKILGKY